MDGPQGMQDARMRQAAHACTRKLQAALHANHGSRCWDAHMHLRVKL